MIRYDFDLIQATDTKKVKTKAKTGIAPVFVLLKKLTS